MTVHPIVLSSENCSSKGIKEHLDNLERQYGEELEQISIECPEEDAKLVYEESRLDWSLGGVLVIGDLTISPSNVVSVRSELGYKDNEAFSHFLYQKAVEAQKIRILTTEDEDSRQHNLYKITKNYNLSIKNAESSSEKLRVIIETICEFERLHPFPDYNNRTFVNLLLSRLLLQNGFDGPLIFYRPNMFDLHSIEELMAETIEAIKNGKKLANGQSVFNFNPENLPTEEKNKFEIISNNFSFGLTEEIKENIRNFKRKFTTEDLIMNLRTGDTLEKVIGTPQLFQMISSAIKNYYSNKNIDNFLNEFDGFLQKIKELSEGNSDLLDSYNELLTLYKFHVPIKKIEDLFEAYGSPISRPIQETNVSSQYKELRQKNRDSELSEVPELANSLTKKTM